MTKTFTIFGGKTKNVVNFTFHNIQKWNENIPVWKCYFNENCKWDFHFEEIVLRIDKDEE